MAFDYSSLAAKARALIERFGRDVTLVRTSETPADANNPQRGATSTTTLAAKAAVFAGKEAEEGSLGIRRGQAGVAYVAVPATGENVLLYDHLNDRGVLRRITGAEIIEPGPTGVLYVLELGGGA